MLFRSSADRLPFFRGAPRVHFLRRAHRRAILHRLAGHAGEHMLERSVDGSASLNPLYFDLRLGNICNLKCTACKPLYSSQIERDPVHAPWIVDAGLRP